MTEAELKKQIKSGLSGAYLFIGEEEYLKRHYRGEARNAICGEESFRSFNILAFDMREKTPEDVMGAIATPPFMSEKKLVEITGIDYNTARDGVLEALAALSEAAKSSGDTVLLLYALAGELDTVTYRSKPLERVRKKLQEKVSEVLFTYGAPAKLAVWVERHFKSEGINAEPSVPRLLIGRCGPGMDALHGEIIKLSCYVKADGRDTVTMEDVRVITAATDREDAFAMANALLEGNMDSAFEALRVLREANEKPTAVLSRITRVYADLVCVKEIAEIGGAMAAASKLKMNEYKARLYTRAVSNVPAKRLEHIFCACIAADMELKSGGAGFIPVERLLCSIASGRRKPE